MTDSVENRAVLSPVDAANAAPRVAFSLSWRLLVLTALFVMIAEILILFPSLARYRVDYLQMRLAEAHLVLTALEASTGQIDPMLRDRLLAQAGMLGMSVYRPNMPPRTLGPNMPQRIPRIYDLRTAMEPELIYDTLDVMLRQDLSVIGVGGLSPADPSVVVEVVLEEKPLCEELWDYGQRILALSLFISLSTAALVYFSLQWLAVRPLKRLTESMTAFQRDPSDPRRIIVPESRSDEVGVAERALSDMQQRLRESLLEKDRLAGVGAAVTKISHDLKNILASAILESERLETAPNVDPHVKQITQGMVRAIERAVKLSASTIRFAKEDLPQATKRDVGLSEIVAAATAETRRQFATLEMAFAPGPRDTFSLDPEMMQRALENLLRNAGEAGATRVDIALSRDGNEFTLRVADNGPGLAAKALDNLFVPFSGSARSGGSGLGLPIARELMRVQGGDLVLGRTAATGAELVIKLPQ
ncbi:MAG: HAMP domain-containing histidine kinase [Rhodobacteraceae bacterium]|nr:HAMP domain-containing histidine kinase [Paracoccaceae bacterium]